MISSNKLFLEFIKLEPRLEKVYVIPDIKTKIRSNNYLTLLYQEAYSGFKEQKIWLDGLNISSYAIFIIRRIRGEVSIIHHHWFQFSDFKDFMKILWVTFWLILYRAIGGKIVWTVHNKYPHNRKLFGLNKQFRKIMARLASKLHVHCNIAIKIMTPILGVSERKFFIIEQPKYNTKLMERNKALKELKIKYNLSNINSSDIIFLMFGRILAYKGMKEVAEIFTQLPEYKKIIIAGRSSKEGIDYIKSIQDLTKEKRNIILRSDGIPEEDVPLFHNAADYVIFNYTDILTSGAAHLARCYDKKIIFSTKGCMNELLEGEKVKKFKHQKELIEILTQIEKDSQFFS